MFRSDKRLACKNHPNAELVEDARAGDLICRECGLVVGDRLIDVSSEWRTFSDETSGGDRSRVGAAQNYLFENDDLTTELRTSAKMQKSTLNISTAMRLAIKQPTTVNIALKRGFDKINEMSYRLNVQQKITKTAHTLYKKFHSLNITNHRREDEVAVTCLFVACRTEGYSRTIREMAKGSGVPLKNIGRTLAWMRSHDSEMNNNKAYDIENLMPRLCNQLSLSQERKVAQLASRIASRCFDLCNIAGRSPATIAAAVILMACQTMNESVKIEQIAMVADVTTTSTKKVYDILNQQRNNLIKA